MPVGRRDFSPAPLGCVACDKRHRGVTRWTNGTRRSWRRDRQFGDSLEMFITKTEVEICAQRFGHFLSEECSYRLARNQKNDLAHKKPECNRVIA